MAEPRVLVTGGSGFIGTNVVDFYLSAGTPVISLDTRTPRNLNHTAIWRSADLLLADEIAEQILEFAPTHVMHLAARTDLDGSTIDDYQANTMGVENIVGALRSTPSVQRVIFASSRLVCEIGYQPRDEFDVCPTTAYGKSKVIGEQIVRENAAASDLEWTIVRPTSIWGPWFDVPYRNFFDAVLRGRYIHPKHHRIQKSFGFVGNTVFQLDKLLFTPSNEGLGQTYFLGDYRPIEVLKWASLIAKSAGVGPVKEMPMWVLKALAHIGDAIETTTRFHAPLTSFRLDNLTTPMIYDMTDLHRIVGELPYAVEAGVEQTLEWISAVDDESRA